MTRKICPKAGSGIDLDLRAGHGLHAVGQRERRAGAVDDVRVVDVVVLDAVANRVRREDVRGLGLILPVHAGVADLEESDAAAAYLRRHGVVGDRRLVDRRQSRRWCCARVPPNLRAATCRVMAPLYLTVWLWPPYDPAAEPGGVGAQERRVALRSVLADRRIAEEARRRCDGRSSICYVPFAA